MANLVVSWPCGAGRANYTFSTSPIETTTPPCPLSPASIVAATSPPCHFSLKLPIAAHAFDTKVGPFPPAAAKGDTIDIALKMNAYMGCH